MLYRWVNLILNRSQIKHPRSSIYAAQHYEPSKSLNPPAIFPLLSYTFSILYLPSIFLYPTPPIFSLSVLHALSQMKANYSNDHPLETEFKCTKAKKFQNSISYRVAKLSKLKFEFSTKILSSFLENV